MMSIVQAIATKKDAIGEALGTRLSQLSRKRWRKILHVLRRRNIQISKQKLNKNSKYNSTMTTGVIRISARLNLTPIELIE